MLLDLPDHLLLHLLGHCSFRQQAALSAANKQLRSAVHRVRLTEALARARGADGSGVGELSYEALPRAGELRLQHDAPPPVGAAFRPPPYRQVLDVFDRLVPPPPGPVEGPLHRWYRQAAELEERADRQIYLADGLDGLTYVGGRDEEVQLPAGFGMATPSSRTGDIFVGFWADGVPQGLGLLIVGGAEPHAWYHGEVHEGTLARRELWTGRPGSSLNLFTLSERNAYLKSPMSVLTRAEVAALPPDFLAALDASSAEAARSRAALEASPDMSQFLEALREERDSLLTFT